MTSINLKKFKKILLIFGTRPETIKMAPLIHALKSAPDYFDVKICITSQHKEMLDQALKIFEIKPDFDLKLMRKNQSLSDLTSMILKKLPKILHKVKPDIIFVHGDTTTTLASSLSAFYLSIPVAHVEAGLRTNNLLSPFPEELNRQITSKLARWHFAPTRLSKKNLQLEGIDPSSVIVTGNTVIDALFLVLGLINKNKNRKRKIILFLNKNLLFNWKNTKFILITSHRRENFGNGILEICKAIMNLAVKYPHIHFVYPVHLNPNIVKPVTENLQGYKNIHILKPLDYEKFIFLLNHSYLVLTDSGGIQEEAPSLGKPVLLMRDTSERPEGLKKKTVKLVGSNHKKIFNGVSKLLDNKSTYHKMSISHNPYGDGLASKRIVDILKKI